MERTPIDARSLGANCGACPLDGTCNPVPAVYHPSPTMIVMDDAPNANGVMQGRPLAGAGGALLTSVFAKVPLDPRELHITHALMCAPKRSMEAKDWNLAIAACRPRLERELAHVAPTVPAIALGGRALQAFIGSDKIFEHLGVAQPSKLVTPERPVLPVLHPTFALPHKAPAYKNVIEIHVRRAWRLAQGRRGAWTWPMTITDEDGDEAILAGIEKLSRASALGVDVETPRIGAPEEWPKLAKLLLNIGVASADPGAELALCVTWPDASDRVRAAMLALLASPVPKVMHNGSFDSMVFHYNGIELGGWDYDTMIAWQIVAPKLKAGLDFVACVLTNAPRWKNAFKDGSKKLAENADDKDLFDVFLHADARERAIYCARDSYLQVFLKRAQSYYFDDDQTRIFQQRMRLTQIGLRMRQAGVEIDEDRRAELRRPYAVRAKWALRNCRRMAKGLGFTRFKEKKAIVWDYETIVSVSKKGVVKEKKKRISGSRRQEVVARTSVVFDPGNIHHVRDLFQKRLGVAGAAPKIEGREERFDAKVMEAFCKNPRLEVRLVAREILRYRKSEKILSTFIDGLPVYPDGKIHIEWKPGQTATLRTASANPNGQNIPQILRGMFRASAGYYLVYMDYSQLELRVIALLANDKPLIEAYARGEDVHRNNARDIFGKEWEEANDEAKDKKRTFGKRFVFGANYNAVARTLWESLVVEFPNLKFSVVAKALEAWFRAHPDIKAWQNAVISEAYKDGYAKEPVLSGHKNHFFGNIDVSIAINFRVQTFAAFLANEMKEKIAAEINWDDGETILFEVHDAFALQVRDPVTWLGRLSTFAEREVTHNGMTMKFPIDMQVSGVNMKPLVNVNAKGEFKRPKHVDVWRSRTLLWIELGKAKLL